MTVCNIIVPSNPTPNGDVHLGHIAGPFIGADVLRRAALNRGEHAALLLGTAWQNNHVSVVARRLGRPHLEVAAEFASRIEQSFSHMGIDYDVMLRHTDIPDIHARSSYAFTRLRRDKTITVREGVAQYCPTTGCEEWRFQGFVTGRCPHCGSPAASGTDCEGCGRYHDDGDLLDPRCAICGTPTVARALHRAYLELEPLRSWFEDYFSSVRMGHSIRVFTEDVLSRPLPAVAVTRPGGFGPLVRDPAVPEQQIFPTFELAPRYVVMTQRLRESMKMKTCDAFQTKTTMMFGFDNAFERMFLFPAVLRAFGSGAALMPEIVQMSHFYLLDGTKFSTSRGHVIGVDEMAGAAGSDALRLRLCATRPESGTTNFSRAAFDASLEVNTVRRLTRWAETATPPPAPYPLLDHDDAVSVLTENSRTLYEALQPESLSCTAAAQAIVRLTSLTDHAGWVDTGGDGADDHRRFTRGLLHVLANGADAILPQTSAKLRSTFRIPQVPFTEDPFTADLGTSHVRT